MADLMRIPLPPERMKEQTAIAGEPYIMEWYPTDGGYASIAIHVYDLLNGAADGVNSTGLSVSMFSDEEAMAELGNNLEKNELRTPQIVGLHPPQVLRHLLDTCSNVEEAKETLLTIKQYYPLWPAIFIIADISGNSFIYEDSTYRYKQNITDGNGKLQIITNFQVNKHKSLDQMPKEFSMATNAFWRYKKLDEVTSGHNGLFSTDNMKYNQQCVNILQMFETVAKDPNHRGIAAGSNSRTLWRSLYNQNEKSMEVSFYLGEETNSGGKIIERRSDYLKFSLDEDYKYDPVKN